MKEQILFNTKEGAISNLMLLNCLRQIKADEADVLYIHTALNFGAPEKSLKKKQLLEEIYQIILNLGVSTIIFPTYTFSFCNGDSFNVQTSKTSMGLLNEYVRNLPEAIRSIDPLMSNVLIGRHTDFVKKIGKNSVGEGSTFDLLHKTSLKVKFLFFGPKIGDCFTHMHYMEEEQNVPYRYNRIFTGQITNENHTYTDSYRLFVRYSNVFPNCGSYIYENLMFEKGISKRVRMGNGLISIVEAQEGYESYIELLKMSPNFYITEIFEKDRNSDDFNVSNMRAL